MRVLVLSAVALNTSQPPCSNAANSSTSIAVRLPPRPMLSVVLSPSIFEPFSRLSNFNLFRRNVGRIHSGSPLRMKSTCENSESLEPSTSASLRDTIR